VVSAIAPARAAEIVLRAEVQADLRTVTGTLELAGEDLALSNPLERLPQPADDLTTFRTFPGAPDAGEMTWTAEGEGAWSFRTVLPRRYGALGALRGRGLWANGGWYPQPVDAAGGLPLADWDVVVTLPAEATGALNDTVGADRLAWSGRSDRAALAVLADGRIRTIGEGEDPILLLEDRRERGLRDRELAAVWAGSRDVAGSGGVVVVEAPMFRRLVRAGPGICYLSDRAFRLTRPLERYHRVPVARGLLSAAGDPPDPWLRGLVAEPQVQAYGVRDGAGSPVTWLRIGRFIPWIDLLLSDGRTAFVGEFFGETWPTDPLADDLGELYRPPVPARVASAWLDDLGGPGTAGAVATMLTLGESLGTAVAAQGLDPSLAQGWRRPMPEQDLRLEVGRSGESWTVEVERDAPEGAAALPVVVEVDGVRSTWATDSGPGTRIWPSEERPGRVVLDPDRHLQQRETAFDTWPARWTATVAAAVYHLNLTQQSFTGLAWFNVRRLYDTRNLFQGSVYTDERNLGGVRLVYRRAFGPLKDRRFRTHSTWLSGGWALLDEDFRPTSQGRFAVGGSAGYAWDTRVDWFFPTGGHRLWVLTDAGLVPGGLEWWWALRGGAPWIWSPHPRHAVALRARGGFATGAVEHRLFSLGGDSTLRGIPAGQVVGSNQAVAMAEWRWAPVRNASIWLPTIWLTELQLAAGLEGGWTGGLVDDGTVGPPGQGALAVGWTLGLGVAGDWFGARTGLLTLTAARPFWSSGLGEAPRVQVYLRGTQAF